MFLGGGRKIPAKFNPWKRDPKEPPPFSEFQKINSFS